MKSGECFVLCLCAVVLLSVTACNITRSASNSNPESGDEISSAVSSSTILKSVSSETQTASSSVFSDAMKESAATVVSEAGKGKTESWVEMAPMSTPRFAWGSAVVGAKIYMFWWTDNG